jgi:hypothetical protein
VIRLVPIETRPKSETRQRLGPTGRARLALPGFSESIAVHGFLWSARTLVLAILSCNVDANCLPSEEYTLAKEPLSRNPVLWGHGAWAQPLCCMLYVLDLGVSQACQTRYCNCTVLVVIDHRPRVGRNRPTICNVWPGQPAMAPAMCRVTAAAAV